MTGERSGPVVVLCERLAAAGWRLGGAQVRCVEPEFAAEALAAAAAEAELVLLSAGFAARLPRAILARALRGPGPLVLVLDETAEVPAVRPAIRYARAALGIGP
ncbi:MAG TPA: hypothetical protein VN790_07805 [Steroidobacteraceae bacterium]|nr:hypothetical protein [Steroidobacteraceae bacterium]